MEYSEDVRVRCRELTRAGSFPADEAGVGTGTASTADDSTVVRMQISADGDGVVRDARFRVLGCSAAIASASLAADRAIGLPVAQVLAIDGERLAAELDLPDEKRPMASLAAEALRRAAGNWSGQA